MQVCVLSFLSLFCCVCVFFNPDGERKIALSSGALQPFLEHFARTPQPCVGPPPNTPLAAPRSCVWNAGPGRASQCPPAGSPCPAPHSPARSAEGSSSQYRPAPSTCGSMPGPVLGGLGGLGRGR